MQAFEVGHLRCVAGFDQGLITHLHQFHGTATQNRLLAEQVGLGFFLEVGLDDAGLAATIGHGITQGQVTGLAGLVLVHGHQMGHAAALGIGVAHGVAGGLGSHHPHVQIGAGHDLVVVHVETVGKCQRGTLLQGRLNLFVDTGDVFVGQQNHDHIGRGNRFVDFSHLQTCLGNLVPGRATLAQTDHHLHAAVVQVLCVGMALAAVTNNGNRLALDEAQIAILVVKNLHVISPL